MAKVYNGNNEIEKRQENGKRRKWIAKIHGRVGWKGERVARREFYAVLMVSGFPFGLMRVS